MNRLLFLLIVVCSDVMSMSMVQSAKRITPHTFCRTHFIVGYKPSHRMFNIQPRVRSIDEKPPIINGSSAHLLDPECLTQSFFTTKHDISSVVLTLLAQAEKSISIAAFSLTDSRIANQLIAAHKKGIDVCVIMDAGNMKQYHSKAQRLINNGISVWRFDSSLRTPPHVQKITYEQLMHLKWIIIDDILIQGSANFTKAAQNGNNIESVMICRCPRTVEEHRQELQKLQSYCVKCTSAVAENKVEKTRQHKE